MELSQQSIFIISIIFSTDFGQATFIAGAGGVCPGCSGPAPSVPPPPPSPQLRPAPLPRQFYAPAPAYPTARAVPNVQYIAVAAPYVPQSSYGPLQQIAYAPAQPTYVRQEAAPVPAAPVASQTVVNVPPSAPVPTPIPASSNAVAYQGGQLTAAAANAQEIPYSQQNGVITRNDATLQADKELVEIYKKIKHIRNQNKAVQYAAPTTNSDASDPKCNDATMREAIIENIDPSPAIAKRQIQKAVRDKIDGNIDAICSTGSFSYLVNTDLYCEVETADITCLVFRQAT